MIIDEIKAFTFSGEYVDVHVWIYGYIENFEIMSPNFRWHFNSYRRQQSLLAPLFCFLSEMTKAGVPLPD